MCQANLQYMKPNNLIMFFKNIIWYNFDIIWFVALKQNLKVWIKVMGED